MTTRSIRSFREYTPKQYVNGGQQWEKRYNDGEFARLVIYKSRITRQDVVRAFAEQEWHHEAQSNGFVY